MTHPLPLQSFFSLKNSSDFQKTIVPYLVTTLSNFTAHCRLSICCYFGWVWQIQNLRRAGLPITEARLQMQEEKMVFLIIAKTTHPLIIGFEDALLKLLKQENLQNFKSNLWWDSQKVHYIKKLFDADHVNCQSPRWCVCTKSLSKTLN